MYSNNILNSQESTTILNACTKKSGNLLKAPRIISAIESVVSPLSVCLSVSPLFDENYESYQTKK